MGRRRLLAAVLRLVHRQPLERHPVLQPRRYRRQYAHDAGPRPAPRPGLVRPRAASARGIEHPLVAARGPADRRTDPASFGRCSAAPRPSAGRSGSRRCSPICCCCSRSRSRSGGWSTAALIRSPSSPCSSPDRPTACSCPSGSTITAGSSLWSRWRYRAIADRNRVRGGIVLGVATALSLAIGLEMLIYLALAAAAMALFWVDDRDERARLGAYAVTLGGGTALAFLIFASYANRLAVCDALSPVWLSDALLGGALLFGLAWLSPADWKRRLALAAGRRTDRRRVPRLDVAALPAAARGRIARGRTLVAEPCARGAAGLSPRLADRDDHPRFAGQRGDRLAAADLAQPDRPRKAAADPRRGRARLCRDRAAVLADPYRPGSADARGPRRGRAGVDPGAGFLVVEICGGARPGRGRRAS